MSGTVGSYSQWLMFTGRSRLLETRLLLTLVDLVSNVGTFREIQTSFSVKYSYVCSFIQILINTKLCC